VQDFVTRVAIEVHSTPGQQDSIHRDAINSGLSLEASLVLEIVVPFRSERVALHLRRRSERVTDFST
jgi:hypothetical protein